MELIRRASAEIENLSLWRIFRNLWNDKAGSSLAHALGKAYLHQMPSFYDSNRDPSAMRKPTDSIEVMSAAPTVTRNRKPRQWGECFAPHLPLWIFKRGSATSFESSKNFFWYVATEAEPNRASSFAIVIQYEMSWIWLILAAGSWQFWVAKKFHTWWSRKKIMLWERKEKPASWVERACPASQNALDRCA